MEEKYLQKFIEVMPVLNEVMLDDITVMVFDIRNMIIAGYSPGKLKRPVKVGDAMDGKRGRAIDTIIKTKKPFLSLTPIDFYGVPAKGLLSPVLDENGEVVAIVSVAKSVENETKIEDFTSSILSSMEQLNAGIEEIAMGSQQLSSFINEIAEFSTQTQEKIKEIDNIIKVIQNISKQSNLLSLNATIEAARAGEAGRGFSVVANEMGKLSNLSKASAEKVSSSLIDMRKAIETIGDEIGKTSESSENQAAATEEIAATSDGIIIDVKNLCGLVKVKTVDELVSNQKK